MALLNTIWIIHTTSNKKDADTDAEFTLLVVRPGNPSGDYTQAFPNMPHNEREKGRTDEYKFDVSTEQVDENAKLKIRIGESHNGWIPSSIWAIGLTKDGRFVVMAHNPSWDPTKVFDNTQDQKSRTREIN
ncbi:hypothetical protein H6G65_17770 [Microcystis elabens FACHB-917]|nr:hypothetical protein [Microcystis elabens FACHB-917]